MKTPDEEDFDRSYALWVAKSSLWGGGYSSPPFLPPRLFCLANVSPKVKKNSKQMPTVENPCKGRRNETNHNKILLYVKGQRQQCLKHAIAFSCIFLEIHSVSLCKCNAFSSQKSGKANVHFEPAANCTLSPTRFPPNKPRLAPTKYAAYNDELRSTTAMNFDELELVATFNEVTKPLENDKLSYQGLPVWDAKPQRQGLKKNN